MKVCKHCGIEKTRSGFYADRAAKDGLRHICKTCARASADKWDKENRAARSAANVRWAERNPERVRAAHRSRHLVRTYSMTEDRWNAMLDAQGGLCAICRKTNPSGGRLAVDHDHACCPDGTSCGDCVRGLLCTRCNTLLVSIENQDWFDKALAYIALHKEVSA